MTEKEFKREIRNFRNKKLIIVKNSGVPKDYILKGAYITPSGNAELTLYDSNKTIEIAIKNIINQREYMIIKERSIL